jgi:diguanylate cyclase (GGDEF)-like protein/PAS domain S-box-containing protein
MQEAEQMPNPSFHDLRKLFELSVDLLCVSASDGNILAVNPAYLSAFGYTEEELIGTSFLRMIHPQDLDRTIAEVAGVGRGETTLLFENRAITATGEIRWFQWSARADDSNGFIYASGRDVTNQHSDRERLQRYADLLERTQSELKDALDELTRVANTDQLTGLLNRRAFEQRATEELSRAARNNHWTGLAIFDIDRFKLINDQHGHPMGDVILREVARRIETGRRQYDVVARWGGEEFIALFPESDLEGAKAAADRIALSVAARPMVLGSLAIDVRVSGGVVSAPGTLVENTFELVAVADHALMEAKRQGRDRVEVEGFVPQRLAS